MGTCMMRVTMVPVAVPLVFPPAPPENGRQPLPTLLGAAARRRCSQADDAATKQCEAWKMMPPEIAPMHEAAQTRPGALSVQPLLKAEEKLEGKRRAAIHQDEIPDIQVRNTFIHIVFPAAASRRTQSCPRNVC